MKKMRWRDKFRYHFDTLMSQGMLSLIALLFGGTALVVVVSGLVIALVDGETGLAVSKSMWVSLMHAIDAGTLTADEGDFLFIFVMSVVTVCGLFITSTLISIINTGLEDKLTSLRKGRSQVLEHDHVVLLGFDEEALNILNELVIANAAHWRRTVVVMDNRDKGEMEDLIHQRIKDAKTTRIICRSGHLDSFADLAICSLETCRSVIINIDDDFMTIKAILACANVLKNSGNDSAYITALIRNAENLDAARIAGGGRAEILYFQSTIAQIMVQTCHQPGLSSVFTELLSYVGNAFYMRHIPGMVGQKMGEINLLFPSSVVIGIVRDGVSMVNPPMDTVLTENDRLILLAEDDSLPAVNSKPVPVHGDLMAPIQHLPAHPKKTMILGYSPLLRQVLLESDAYAAPGSTTILAAGPEPLDNAFLPETSELHNISLDVHTCDIFSERKLEKLMEEAPENILVLTDPRADDEAADAQTLMLLLYLRDIAKRRNLDFTITCEMRSIQNQELAQATRANDFVVSSNITALMMTQISQTRQHHDILESLLEEAGSEIYIKPVFRYVQCAMPVDFYTIGAAAVRYGEIAIGYKKMHKGQKNFDIVLNPPKGQTEIFSQVDSIIVIAEN